MGKALVIGQEGYESHDISVRTFFLNDAPTGWTCNLAILGSGTPSGNIVTFENSVADCVQYAINNSYDLIIRSYTGLYSYKLEWERAFENGIIVFHAHGSNDFIRLSSPPHLLEACIAVSGGDEANEGSYGPGLELYTNAGGLTEQSWATPAAAAKFASIRDTYNENLFDSRQRLRESCNLYLSGWTEENGYGKINTISNSDPGLGSPLNFIVYKNYDNLSVNFSWNNFISTNFQATIIKKSTGEIIYSGADESFTWISDVVGSEEFKIYSGDSEGNISKLESFCSATIFELESNRLPDDLNPVGTLTVRRQQSKVILIAGVVNNAERYMFYRDGVLIKESVSPQINDFITKRSKAYRYNYTAVKDNQTTALSNTVEILFSDEAVQPISGYTSQAIERLNQYSMEDITWNFKKNGFDLDLKTHTQNLNFGE